MGQKKRLDIGNLWYGSSGNSCVSPLQLFSSLLDSLNSSAHQGLFSCQQVLFYGRASAPRRASFRERSSLCSLLSPSDWNLTINSSQKSPSTHLSPVKCQCLLKVDTEPALHSHGPQDPAPRMTSSDWTNTCRFTSGIVVVLQIFSHYIPAENNFYTSKLAS